MLALVIFGILIAYLAIAIFFVRATLRSAREAGLATKQRWVRGGLVALVFYLIPFWDWIPTVVAHQYYCATEAKFEVYKTIEQWKADNAEVVQELRFDRDAVPQRAGAVSRFPLNQRIEVVRTLAQSVFLSVTREAAQVVDAKRGEIVASYVDFRTGYAPFGVGGEGAWKFWLKRQACDEGANGAGDSFARFNADWIRFGKGSK